MEENLAEIERSGAVTDDKVYCVYIAPDKGSILEHARRGGFPADRISEVRLITDPTTAETQPAA